MASIVVKSKTVSRRRPGHGHHQIPLPDNVLRTLVKFVPHHDLLNCRLVCKDWSMPATMEMRKYIWKTISFYQRSGFGESSKRDLRQLMEIFRNSALIPIVSFKLNLEFYEPENESTIKEFFKLMGPILQNLVINFELLGWSRPDLWPITKFLPAIKLEKLKSIEFSFDGTYPVYDDWFLNPKKSDRRRKFLTACLAATPNLNHISLKSDTDLSFLLDALEPSPLPYLNSLAFISTDIENEDMGRLSRSGIKLKRLSFCPEFPKGESKAAVTEFFASQSKSLEYLKVMAYKSTTFKYEFPVMEHLKVLSVEYNMHRGLQFLRYNKPVFDGEKPEDHKVALRIKEINWPTLFPKLEELRIRTYDGDLVEVIDVGDLFPNYKVSPPHPGVKILAFGLGCYPQIGIFLWLEIQCLFPNVETLKIPLLEDIEDSFVEEFYINGFPKLTNLVLEVEDFHDIYEEEEVLETQIRNLRASIMSLTPATASNIMTHKLKNFQHIRFEIQYYNKSCCDFKTIRKTYDCAWILTLLSQIAAESEEDSSDSEEGENSNSGENEENYVESYNSESDIEDLDQDPNPRPAKIPRLGLESESESGK